MAASTPMIDQTVTINNPSDGDAGAIGAIHATLKRVLAKANPKANSKIKHPSYMKMVAEAIKTLHERGGSSRRAIREYLISNFEITSDDPTIDRSLRQTLARGVADGSLTQIKQSFTLGKTSKKNKPSKQPTKRSSNKSRSVSKAKAKTSKPNKPKSKVNKPKSKVNKRGKGGKPVKRAKSSFKRSSNHKTNKTNKTNKKKASGKESQRKSSPHTAAKGL
jgi:histone H1/5